MNHSQIKRRLYVMICFYIVYINLAFKHICDNCGCSPYNENVYYV